MAQESLDWISRIAQTDDGQRAADEPGDRCGLLLELPPTTLRQRDSDHLPSQDGPVHEDSERSHRLAEMDHQ
eukprot:3218206-Prorocentrum_lima.AAC.1